MARPKICRHVGCSPEAVYFKPRGIPVSLLEEVEVTVDELEAIRLADLDGLYQEDAAARMNVSRQTFGRIVESARRKVADALLGGKALKIEGGNVEMKASARQFKCYDCEHTWEVPFGTGRPPECPSCRNRNIRRSGGGRGDCGPNRERHGRGRCGPPGVQEQ
ncbi:MAG: DUF134 domain-containing protein [Deltaproteobacteria bacterium]|nr:DUF134 domain-containing protein [Deltaproteobacteria bacterium]